MAEQTKKAWYKKWWVWVIAILVLAGIGSAISGGGIIVKRISTKRC